MRRMVPVTLVTGLHAVAGVALLSTGIIHIQSSPEPLQVVLLKTPPQSPPPAESVRLPPVQLTVPMPEVDVPNPVVWTAPVAVQSVAAPVSEPMVQPATAVSPPTEVVTVRDSELTYRRVPVISRPPASRRAGEHGTVYLLVYIDTEGRVQQVKVKRSSSFERLDQTAAKAMTHARFQPYIKDGKALPIMVIVPVEFPA
jgi:protein TonB